MMNRARIGRSTCLFAACLFFAAVTTVLANDDAVANDRHLKSTERDVRDGVAAYRKQNFDRAYALLNPWAEKGDREAKYWVARMYEKGEGRKEDPERAIALYKASAEAGFARAQYKVAAGYLYGYGSIKKDDAKAREWLIKSADGGYRRAQRMLAEGYRQGKLGFPVDAEKAAYWEKQAEK